LIPIEDSGARCVAAVEIAWCARFWIDVCQFWNKHSTKTGVFRTVLRLKF
jgi:hypothetical protein